MLQSGININFKFIFHLNSILQIFFETFKTLSLIWKFEKVMKIFIVFFIFIFFTSCEEKAPPKVVLIPKIEITVQGKIIPIDSARITKIKDSSVIAFYNTSQNKTFWLANSSRNKLHLVLK